MNNEIADNLALISLKIRDDRNELWRKYYNRIKKATSPIIAGQFLLEALAVGLFGGILGVALGSLAILIAVWIAGWVFTLAQWLPPAGILLHAVGAPVSFSRPIAYLE